MGYLVFCYAAVVAVLVRAVTDEEIFREARTWIHDRCLAPGRCWPLRKFAYLVTCEFCCSFWVSLIVVTGILQYRLGPDDWRGYGVALFVTMGLANVYLAIFSLLRVDLRKERAVAEHVERRKSA